jgi:glycine cleavage system transcriptional repressor
MSEDRLVAVTVVGTDRPGIVAAVTKTLFEVGCNLEDATSTILRGHFTMTLIVGAPGEMNAETLEHVLQVVASQLSLLITVKPVSEVQERAPDPTHMISVYGADKPGIVYRVTEALAAGGDNITDLTSRVIESGDEPVYAVMLEVALSDAGATERALASLHEELGLEVSVTPIETDVL